MSAFDEALATIRLEGEAKDKKIAALEKENRELKETIEAIRGKPKFYTVADIAKMLSCSKTTIYRAIDSGIIRAGYLSGIESSQNSRKLIPESELAKLVRFKN